MNQRALILAIAAFWTAAQPAQAQQPYPSKPLRIIVSVPPGGGMDGICRVVAKEMVASLGQPVVVENRPGGGENIGINSVAKSAPDGYTLLFSSNTIAMNPSLYKSLPYDAMKDLAAVGRITTMTMLIVSHPSVPVRNISELISYAKQNPDKLSYGTPGTGTPHHLAMELFKSAAGIRIIHVPYKGTGPGISDMLGGHIPLLVATTAPIKQQVQQGLVRALGSMDRTRHAEFKDVAAINETLPGFDVGIWHGIFAPTGTPAPIMRKLSGVLQSVVAEPQFKNQMSAMGVESRWVAPDEVMTLLKSEQDKWADATRKAGIEPE